MVELGKNSIGIIRFELSVKILFFVNIDKANTSTSIVVVQVSVLDGDMVKPFLEFRDFKENESFRVVDESLMAIYHHFLDVLALEVDWQLGGNGGEGEVKFRKTIVVSAFFEDDVEVIGDGSLLNNSVSGLCSLLG